MSPSTTRRGGLMFRILAITLAITALIAYTNAAFVPGGAPIDSSNLFKRQTSTIKTELKPQLSTQAVIYEVDDGQAFIDAKNRWSDYAAPGVSAVVKVYTEQDVVKTVQYCNTKNRKWFVQNTGHGWGRLDQLTDVVLIKVDSMESISININTNQVTIGAGVDMGQLIQALFAQQRQTTLGTCDCPGVIGALLGGGHGRLQGKYGLIADQLISAKVVLHDGSVVTASSSQNQDLFWALRGAGHNFGIVTEATLKIYPVQNGGNHYNAVTFYEEWQLEQIFGAMNNITLPELSSAYVMFFSTQNTTRQFLAIDFTYAGRVEDGRALLHSIFDVRLPQRTDRVEKTVPWSRLNAEGMLGIAQQWCVRGIRKNSHSTGVVFYNMQDVRTVWNGYKAIIKENPSAWQSMYIWETYPMQGMRNRDWTTTAYSNRDINHIVVAFLIYENAALDATMTAYGTNTFRNIINSRNGFYGKPRVYVNYGQGYEKPAEYYGWESWRQTKLAKLKTQYDPLNRLSGYHPVPKTTGSAWNT